MTPMQDSLFPHPSATPGERVILMDLNVALSENFDDMRKHSFPHFISSVERYRANMVDLLRAEYVVLITARDARWAKATLRRIHEQTGWLPQEAHFNDTGLTGRDAAEVKRRLLHQYVLPEHGTNLSRYLAIESNSDTRKMYAAQGIRAIDCDRHNSWHVIPA